MQDLSAHLVGLYVHDLSPSSVACRMDCQHTSAGVPSSRDTEQRTGERKGTLGEGLEDERFQESLISPAVSG